MAWNLGQRCCVRVCAHGRARRVHSAATCALVATATANWLSSTPPGAATPSAVVEAIIDFLESQPGASHWMCDWRPDHLRAQAAAAGARYAAGTQLGVLDGVPYAVKDALDAFPFKSGAGTSFLGDM